MSTSNIFNKRNVIVVPGQMVHTDIDQFMAGVKILEDVVTRPWEVKELRQSEDVNKWFEEPQNISGIQPNLIDLIKDISSIKEPIRILDVGCHGGYLYDYFLKYVFKDETKFEYVGIDVQKEVVELAQEIHTFAKNAEFLQGDIFSLPKLFPPKTFNVVCCYRVLIHIPFFQECIRNLCDAALNLVHIALHVRTKNSCTKYYEINWDTHQVSSYFIRYFELSSLYNILRVLDINTFKVIVRDKKEYSTLSLEM
ncbi:MAG: class I SAM-dependent methyltransferase [Candidatus Heimdallarchaeota archaeon]|nr:class I SAM-dependent methyltransferase [Candidatus Heimdallarchaeota archaeon]